MSKLEDKLVDSINKPEQKKAVVKKTVVKKSTVTKGTTTAKLPTTNSTGHPRRIWPD